MDGYPAKLIHAPRSDSTFPGPPTHLGNGQQPATQVTLLMRDGSRMALDLADPWRQAPDLAMALGPHTGNAGPISFELADGSRILLPGSEIMGLHLPPEPQPTAAHPMNSARHLARLTYPETEPQDAEIHRVGDWRIMRIQNFLPKEVAQNLYRYAISKQSEFQQSKVLSNDPEYRKSSVLFRFVEYEAMFAKALCAAFPPICQAIAVPEFELANVECQLTATFDRGYFKPHFDNAAALGHRRITYVYFFHREPQPFVGGDLRFFDHNPFAAQQSAIRHCLDIAPVHNSIVFFDSSCFHEVRDVVGNPPGFETARFTINGWLSRSRSE